MPDDVAADIPVDEAGSVQAAQEAAAARVQRRYPNATRVDDNAQPDQAPSDGLPSDRTDALPSDLDPNLAGEEAGLKERYRLSQVDGFYRGSVMGAARLRSMSYLVSEPDPPDLSPEEKKARNALRDEYHNIVADLGRYDLMAPFGSTMEAIASFGGQVTGGLLSPESFIATPAKGATMLARVGKAALGQAAIQLATDPVVQALSVKSGVQAEYEPVRTAVAPFVGAIIGGGLHFGGELLSNTALKRIKSELATDDPQMRAPDVAPSETPRTAPEGTGTIVENADAGAVPSIDQRSGLQDQPTVFDALKSLRDAPDSGADVLPTAKPEQLSRLSEIVAGKSDAELQEISVGVARQFGEKPAVSAKPSVSSEVAALMPSDAQALAQRASGGTLAMERARPDTGVPSQQQTTTGTAVATVAQSSPQQQTAIRSLQQQAFDLADAIDVPLRQGRIGRSSALGIYKPGSGIIRVREVPDFEVVAHEAGHAIEGKVGKELTALTQAHGNELAPLVSNPAAYDPSKHVQEGFAEWIRRYIGNPAHAEQIAPNFTAAFRTFMQGKHPDILKAIDDAGQAYRAYIEAPSVDAIGAVRRSVAEEPRGFGKVTASLRENGFFGSIKSVMQNVYTALLDDKAPMTRVVRDLASAIRDKEGNLVDLKGADNPDVLLRLFERSHQAAVRDMMDGVRGYHSIEPQGPSLSDAIRKATGDASIFGKWDAEKVKDFDNYLIARRAEYLWRRFENGDLARPPTAFSKADAVVAMAEMERANPTLREASDMVHAWTRQLLRKQYDGGLIPAELYDKLIAQEFYVPFMRDLSDKPLAGGAGGGGARDRVADTVMRMQGSSRDIKSPLESLMTQAFLVDRTLAHNDIIRSLVSLSERAGREGGRYVETIPAMEAKKYNFDLGQSVERVALEKGMDPDDAKVLVHSLTDVFGEDPVVGSFFRMEPAGKRGEPIVFYKEGGQMRAARVMSNEEGHALYEILTALPKPLTDMWSMMIGATTSLMRAGITSNPIFALTNYIRDQFAVAILRKDYVPIASGMRGLASEVTQGKSAVLYGYGGGVSGGASITPAERAIESDINALAKKGYLVNRLTSFKGLTELAGVTESGTRNSVFGKVFAAKKEQGLSDYEAMIEAAFQAQDLLDFSRHGSRTDAIRKYIPFLNAYAQGMDKARRTVLEPLLRDQVFTSDIEALGNVGPNAARVANNAVFGLVKVFGVGGVLGAGWAALNADSEAYQDASPNVKASHVVVPWGNKIILVPKPFELSIGFTAGEYAYQALAQNDPRAASQFATAAWDALTQSNPLYDIPLVKTSFELKTGKSLFTGRDIVPGSLQRLLPAQQYTDRTSAMAKQIGQWIGVSPIKVDYAVGSAFGLWGRDIMALSSGIDPDAPAQSWEDRVFFRRLLKDPTRTSDATTKFWDYMGQTTGKYNQNVATYDDMVKKFHDADAKNFLNTLPSPERAFVIMKSAASESGKPAFNADQKRLHPLQRAYDAVTLLNGLRRQLSDNSFSKFADGENVRLDPTMRRDIIENVRELAQAEMRNSFVIMKEPGYANRALIDLNPIMDKIDAISPEVGEEIRTRYATAKVYTTKAVADAYPKMQSDLLRSGSDADMRGLASDAKAEGYEFSGERSRKPQKRRVTIPAQ